jgi:hypothetical protein
VPHSFSTGTICSPLVKELTVKRKQIFGSEGPTDMKCITLAKNTEFAISLLHAE